MKNSVLFMVLCFMAMLSCNKYEDFTVSNPGKNDVIDKPIVVSRSDVNRFLADTVSGGLVIVKTISGEVLPSQCDDVNGDGVWDELVFLTDLEAGENKKVVFEPSDSTPEFTIRTNIRFGRMEKPFEEVSGDVRMKTNDTKFTAPVYQMEGPAWENDFIAFRNYYDARNGMDIFGKTSSDMVLDSVGVNGREYHTLADWGMDILKVGNSLGAGAIAIAIGDSVYRVGLCEEGTYKLVAEGPVRAVLELNYKNVPAGGRLYQVKHEISIYAGERFYRSKVWIDGLQGDEQLATGIVNLQDVPADSLSEGSMKVIYSLGNQGYSGEILGMGILVPSHLFIKLSEAPIEGSGIVNTHLVYIKVSGEVPAEYRFAAVWETRDPEVKNAAFFTNVLKEAARK